MFVINYFTDDVIHVSICFHITGVPWNAKRVIWDSKCRSCNKEFKNKIYLSKHFRSLHSWEFAGKGDFTYTIKRNIDTREISYTCNGCDRSFNTSLMLHKHSSDSTRNCEKCGKLFHRSDHFQKHQQVRTDDNLMRVFSVESRCLWRKICVVTTLLFILERNFINVVFVIAFTTKKYLKIHNMVHTGETPYVCKICGLAFKFNPNLRRHMKDVHTGVQCHWSDICNLQLRQSGKPDGSYA